MPVFSPYQPPPDPGPAKKGWQDYLTSGLQIAGGIAGGVAGSTTGPMGALAGASAGYGLGGMLGGAIDDRQDMGAKNQAQGMQQALAGATNFMNSEGMERWRKESMVDQEAEFAKKGSAIYDPLSKGKPQLPSGPAPGWDPTKGQQQFVPKKWGPQSPWSR